MAINKLHDEFRSLDMSTGWETPAGYPAGIQQKILSGALDEANKRGSRTRLLRFEPGVYPPFRFQSARSCRDRSSIVRRHYNPLRRAAV